MTSLHDAIVSGLKSAKDKGLTKDSDIAFAIMVAIDAADLKVRPAKSLDPATAFKKSL